MKILHLAWDMKIPGYNGGSMHELGIATALSNIGNEVMIICEKTAENEPKNIGKVKIERIKWRHSSVILSQASLLFKATLTLIKKMITFRPKIIYERYRILGGYGMIIGRIFGKETILEINDPTIDAPYIEKKISKLEFIAASLWERLIFSCCKKIVCHHKSMVLRADTKKVKIITNGVDTELFNTEKFGKKTMWKNKFVCLFVGSFFKTHGYDLILEAAKIMKNYKDIIFVMVGKEMKNYDNVIFMGKVEPEKIPKIIHNSSVCFCLADKENYEPMKKMGFYFSPIKLFEYMSMAKPVIVSNEDNLTKIIKNNENGIVIKNSPKEIKKAIIKIYKNRKLMVKIGKNNREKCINNYDWKIIARDIIK
jgi:glycosyltransferase involved in cell wall biosynthesis